MDDRIMRKIQRIMGKMKCPKNFKCAENGFEQLCKARDVEIEEYLECLEGEPAKCPFALSFGYAHLCRCPLRVFIAKELKK